MSHTSRSLRRAMLRLAGATGLALALPATLAASPAASPATATEVAQDAAMAKIIAGQHDEMIARLRDWIALPTIAAEGLNIEEGAQMMEKVLRDAGFGQTRIVPTSGSPSVFGYLDAGAERTIAVYFMYDVKQYDAEKWTTPPLAGELVAREGLGEVMLARGAINTKGPQMAFLAALHAYRKANRLPPVNIALIAEGEEEVGSAHLAEALADPEVKRRLDQSIGMFYCSAAQSSDGFVSVDLGSKGMIEAELTAHGAKGIGPDHDIHSGYAAVADSPVWHLVKALSSMTNADGTQVTIDGWNDNVRAPTAREEELIDLRAAELDEGLMKEEFGIERWIAGVDYRTALDRMANAPTANIEGISGGYTGEGGKTILPSSATAKMDFRLVPGQTAEDAKAKLRAHLDAHGFADIDVTFTGGLDPSQTAEDAALTQALIANLKARGVPYSLDPRNPTSGPTYLFTDKLFSLPFVSVGLGLGGRFHVPDEFYLINSTNPNVAGFDEVSGFYIDLLEDVATRPL
ncbi:M20/M25/M40 family metallo-hydrolase [Novosphingobium sp. MBES04]|uniref:M20/M25/M40 family metallo-hydrolase n=1 Tax=Novosphingobium sp. MBES04 TaxID=1206458 RepID=UPI000694A750|nr:M20/M25/M40 family metallo-hydrolase [Novosphingobium sp. MBES04]GAM04999.1 twin-arginine translocation pathway signal [Novosphingobium sp. MBES04]